MCAWCIDSIMNSCLECGRETSNQKFCSAVCNCRYRNRFPYIRTELHKKMRSVSYRGRPGYFTGRKHIEETKRKLSISSRGRVVSEAQKEKQRLKVLGRKLTEETRAKMRASASHIHSEEHNTNMRNRKRELWSDLSYANRTLKLMRGNVRPNKLEISFQTILDEIFPSEWKYVGDYKLVIGRKFPDFVNINNKKKLIELFGTYWHRGDNPDSRISHFKKYGYDCLVIWESELNNKSMIEEKIKDFVGG